MVHIMSEKEFNLEPEFDDANKNDQPEELEGASQQSPQQAKKKNKEADFETALKRLETIVSEMENGELSLDDCMKHFEEGSKLAGICGTKLEETEKKIEILVKKNEANSTWQNYVQDSRVQNDQEHTEF